MIKKRILSAFISLFICCPIGLTACQVPQTQEEHCFNAFVSLEMNDENNAVTKQISAAIAQRVPVICLTSLLAQLEKTGDPRIRVLQFESSWTFFTTVEGDIAVLLPFGHSDSTEAQKLLSKFGLTNLRHVSSKDIIETLKTAQKPTSLMKQFDQLFIKNQLDNPVPKKHFYLIGHGVTGITIAGIPVIQLQRGEESLFSEFLKTMASINTELIYIDSCYTAGPNIITLQNELILQAKKLFQSPSIPFMVIVQATTDELTLGSDEGVIKKGGKFVVVRDYFKNFFSNVDRYFNEQNREDIPPKERITLANILMPLYENYPSLDRLPSVRLPGKNSFFRPVIVDKIKTITFLDVRRLLTKEIFQQRFGHGEVTYDEKNIFIGDGIKYVLCYPAVPIHVSIASEQPLIMLSKIPGTACHIFDSVTFERSISNSTIHHELGNLFLKPLLWTAIDTEGEEEGTQKKMITYCYGESLKSWFIKLITYYQNETKYTLEDVIIVKYASPARKVNPDHYGELWYKRDGKYYMRYGTSISSEHTVEEQEYWQRAADILLNTLPDEKAIYEATGGGQDISSIKNAIARLFPQIEAASALKISLELAKMRGEIAADMSEDFHFANNFIKDKIIPFIQSYHADLEEEHVPQFISLVKKIIDDNLAKKRPPTLKQLIVFVINRISGELSKYTPELMPTTIRHELENLLRYMYAKLIAKTAAELATVDKSKLDTITHITKQLFIDDLLDAENVTKINLTMKKIVEDVIDYDHRNRNPKKYSHSRIDYFFKEIAARIEQLKNEQTKKALKTIALQTRDYANVLLMAY